MPNPVNQIIDLGGTQGNAAGYISGVTNADYFQQAKVTVTDSTGTTVASGTFQGRGEQNTPILLTSGDTLLQFSKAQLPLTLNVTVSFSSNGTTFQQNGPNNVILNQLVDNQFVETYQITSEDTVDQDFNDIILTATFIKH